MAHFAGIDKDGIVVNTIVVPDEQEANGSQHCHELTKNNEKYSSVVQWIQTSYNTMHNKHLEGGTPLRGNYAIKGSIYLADSDVFVDPQPFESWVLNQECWCWEAPVTKPDDGKLHIWDEETISWVEVTAESE